jgi:hypothetical protein
MLHLWISFQKRRDSRGNGLSFGHHIQVQRKKDRCDQVDGGAGAGGQKANARHDSRALHHPKSLLKFGRATASHICEMNLVLK